MQQRKRGKVENNNSSLHYKCRINQIFGKLNSTSRHECQNKNVSAETLAQLGGWRDDTGNSVRQLTVWNFSDFIMLVFHCKCCHLGEYQIQQSFKSNVVNGSIYYVTANFMVLSRSLNKMSVLKKLCHHLE